MWLYFTVCWLWMHLRLGWDIHSKVQSNRSNIGLRGLWQANMWVCTLHNRMFKHIYIYLHMHVSQQVYKQPQSLLGVPKCALFRFSVTREYLSPAGSCQLMCRSWITEVLHHWDTVRKIITSITFIKVISMVHVHTID